MKIWKISEGNEKIQREQMKSVLFKVNNSLDTFTPAYVGIIGVGYAIPP